MTQLYRLNGSSWSCVNPTKAGYSGWIRCCNMRQQLLTSAASFRRIFTGAHGPLAHRGLLWPLRPPGEEAPLHPRAVGLRAGPPASGPPARHHLGDLSRRPAGCPHSAGRPACGCHENLSQCRSSDGNTSTRPTPFPTTSRLPSASSTVQPDSQRSSAPEYFSTTSPTAKSADSGPGIRPGRGADADAAGRAVWPLRW
jgi:hypothetical protein